ncbi:hypothetical protein GCM10009069_09600 [Algimonas arctica]|uniref:Uncharacterized protein n=1 Tax=Algimonas arctica TaxID=1479486 RepID=A0A8J3CPR0_9PROT|nr:hypothetical protein [Algimonas arctica]GHA88680.1 hypothetical protein GCM10009069_09600 [Algimonas arctica]
MWWFIELDNYPEELAPSFDSSGAVSTPFRDWWSAKQISFPNVPEEVAREWLHRHWGLSTFHWVPSEKYNFFREKIDSTELRKIRTSWSRFREDNTPALDQGKFICGDHPSRKWPFDKIWLEKFMRAEASFPSPIICLDNRNGHLARLQDVPAIDKSLPNEMILVEGHTRLNIGLYLQSIDAMATKVEIFRLEYSA